MEVTNPRTERVLCHLAVGLSPKEAARLEGIPLRTASALRSNPVYQQALTNALSQMETALADQLPPLLELALERVTTVLNTPGYPTRQLRAAEILLNLTALLLKVERASTGNATRN